MVFGFSLNKIIVEIEILELANNSYSSLCFLPNFIILNLFLGKSF
jgi:hypothetical protein